MEYLMRMSYLEIPYMANFPILQIGLRHVHIFRIIGPLGAEPPVMDGFPKGQ